MAITQFSFYLDVGLTSQTRDLLVRLPRPDGPETVPTPNIELQKSLGNMAALFEEMNHIFDIQPNRRILINSYRDLFIRYPLPLDQPPVHSAKKPFIACLVTFICLPILAFISAIFLTINRGRMAFYIQKALSRMQEHRANFARNSADPNILEAFSTLEEQLKTEITHQNINTIAAAIATLALILVPIIAGGVIHYFLQGSTSLPIKFLAIASGALMGIALITAVINRVLHSKDKEIQRREILQPWGIINEQCPIQLARFPELRKYVESRKDEAVYWVRTVREGKWIDIGRTVQDLSCTLDVTIANREIGGPHEASSDDSPDAASKDMAPPGRPARVDSAPDAAHVSGGPDG